MFPPSDELSRKFALSRFQAAVDTTFELHRGGGLPAISLRLAEITVRAAPKGYEQFAALFEGPAEPLLPQATYAVTHPAFGELPLFIVPVARSATSASYEACVVRRADPSESRT